MRSSLSPMTAIRCIVAGFSNWQYHYSVPRNSAKSNPSSTFLMSFFSSFFEAIFSDSMVASWSTFAASA